MLQIIKEAFDTKVPVNLNTGLIAMHMSTVVRTNRTDTDLFEKTRRINKLARIVYRGVGRAKAKRVANEACDLLSSITEVTPWNEDEVKACKSEFRKVWTAACSTHVNKDLRV